MKRLPILFTVLLFASRFAMAQGTLTVLNTGSGTPLITETRSLVVGTELVQPILTFNFGFATDESSVPGTFQDSFTVTVQSSNQLFTVIYLTVDANGLVLAPPTPGALVIDPATINANALAYPSLQPVLANQRAYAMSAAIPNQFLGSFVNVYFDLFDNLNLTASQGWFSDLRVVAVPEPQTWTLLLLAGAFGWGGNRFRR